MNAADEIMTINERYRSILDNMLEGCQIIAFDWRYLYLNGEAARQGRRLKDELLGCAMMEAYPGIENTELFAVMRSSMVERVQHNIENEFTYPDGSRGWFELRIQPVTEGIFILSMDITERKKAEEKLNKQLDELQRWKAATVGRELRMKELKDENEMLKARIEEME